MIVRTTCIAIASMSIFSSCKKDDDNGNRLELLTTGSWKLVSTQEKVNNGAWVEYIDDYEDCSLDDYLKFNTNSLVEFNAGPTLCDPSEDQSYTVPWSFEDGQSKINIEGDLANIETLNSNTLTVTFIEVDGGVTYYYKDVFNH